MKPTFREFVRGRLDPSPAQNPADYLYSLADLFQEWADLPETNSDSKVLFYTPDGRAAPVGWRVVLFRDMVIAVHPDHKPRWCYQSDRLEFDDWKELEVS